MPRPQQIAISAGARFAADVDVFIEEGCDRATIRRCRCRPDGFPLVDALLVASHGTMRVCARLKLKARNESELMESEDGKGRSRKREAESSWREREGRASAEKNEELAWARC